MIEKPQIKQKDRTAKAMDCSKRECPSKNRNRYSTMQTATNMETTGLVLKEGIFSFCISIRYDIIVANRFRGMPCRVSHSCALDGFAKMFLQANIFASGIQ